MGCIPSKQTVLQGLDEHQKTTVNGRTRKFTFLKRVKQPKHKTPRKPRLPSPEIPSDAPPWVTGHAVMTVHRDENSGEVYLTEKSR